MNSSLYGRYSSLKPDSAEYCSTPSDSKCMKTSLVEEMLLDGIAVPQYSPIMAAEFESPSYNVKESQLKFRFDVIEIVLCCIMRKLNLPTTRVVFYIKADETNLNQLSKGELNKPSQVQVVVIISRKSR